MANGMSSSVSSHIFRPYSSFGAIVILSIYTTTLTYLSIITNKAVKMIAMKIVKFVEVATLSHRHEETGGFLKVLRVDGGHLRE